MNRQAANTKSECNQIDCQLNGGTLEIAISGEIDHHNARRLRSAIDEKIYLYRPKIVALDVSGVSFMDSSGLGLILGRFTLTRELGGELRVLNPNESVEKILDLAGTSRLITIEKNGKIN